jgi:hypothetical protein
MTDREGGKEGGPAEGGHGPLSFGPDGEERRWAHRRDPDLEDEAGKEAAREEPPPSARPPGGRYGWLLGVIAFAIVVYITVNSIRTEGPGSRGVVGGQTLPPFAAPLVLSGLQGDANVSTRKGGGASGRRPACDVHGRDVLNICELGERSPVVLAFFATRTGRDCERQLDGIEDVRAGFPGVRFAAVAVRGDRGSLRRLVRRHRWGFPIGYDRDGAVANLYGVAVCPTVSFAYPGRAVMETSLGFLDRRELSARVSKLVAASRQRGWKPPA